MMRDSMSSPVTSEFHCDSRSRRSLPVMPWPSLTLHRLLQQTARICELTVSMACKERLQWKKASAFWPAALRTGVSSRAFATRVVGVGVGRAGLSLVVLLYHYLLQLEWW